MTYCVLLFQLKSRDWLKHAVSQCCLIYSPCLNELPLTPNNAELFRSLRHFLATPAGQIEAAQELPETGKPSAHVNNEYNLLHVYVDV